MDVRIKGWLLEELFSLQKTYSLEQNANMIPKEATKTNLWI